MLIHRIRIKNFLSYDLFEWEAIDPQLNVMVGPNGAGKTNLFNAVRAALDIVSQGDRTLWQNVSHTGETNPAFQIQLDIEWNDDWEQEVLTTFLKAVLGDDRALQAQIEATPGDAFQRFSELVDKQLPKSWASFLFKGTLNVEYQGMSRWRSAFLCLGSSVGCQIGLENTGQDSMLGLTGTPSQRPQQSHLFARWLQLLEPQAKKEVIDYVRDGLGNPRLAFPDWSDLLSGFNVFFFTSPPLGFRPTHQRFETVSGLQVTKNNIDPRTVLARLMNFQTVLTRNVRRLPRRSFSIARLEDDHVGLDDGDLLALHLFLLKDGEKQRDPKRYERIETIFRRLTRRSFHVGPTAAENKPGSDLLSLRVVTREDGRDIPLEFSGAGVSEALLLSAAIAADGKVVVLDEPALNLHPAVQGRLAGELPRHNKIQFLATTHSQILVSPEAITKTSRFYKRDQATQRAALDAAALDSEQLATLEKELRRSSDARGLLFVSGVILVEGETELGALPIWFQKRFSESLEDCDIAIYSVGGDSGFRTYVQFLQAFDVPWAIICDRPVIVDRSPSRISAQLRATGVPVPDDKGAKEADRRSRLAKYGVFSPLRMPQKEFDDLDVIRRHRKDAISVVGASKVRIGRYVAEQYDCPKPVATVLDRLRRYLAPKMR